MLSSSTRDLPHMKQGDKYSLSRPISKETSMANPSFRVYHGVSGAVPFMWESQPGTPKHTFSSDTSLPPRSLSPPPSYYFNNINTNTIKKYSRSSKFLDALLLRINHKKVGVTTSQYNAASSISSLSPLSSWSSRSSMSTSVPMRHSKVLSSPRSSTFFSAGTGKDGADGGLRGRHMVFIMKKALLSVFSCSSS